MGANFDDDPFTRKFFREASGFDIRYGYTIPIHHRYGRFAVLTFATRHLPRTVKGHIDSAKASFGIRTAKEAGVLFMQSSTRSHPFIQPTRS